MLRTNKKHIVHVLDSVGPQNRGEHSERGATVKVAPCELAAFSAETGAAERGGELEEPEGVKHPPLVLNQSPFKKRSV